jgi:hypothetical protein
MRAIDDTDEDANTGDGGEFDPAESALLLAHAQRDARRRFELRPPWITAAMGPLILAAYVVLWLSTRGQDPYRGPSLGAVALVYAVVAVSFAVAAIVYRRATSAVAGPSARRRRLEGIALGLSVLASPVIQGAMKHQGAGDGVVYGVIPAAAPLIVIGTTLVGIAAAKDDRPQFGAALIVIGAGVVAAFVGPSGAWLAAGIGLFAAVEGYAVATGHRPIDGR